MLNYDDSHDIVKKDKLKTFFNKFPELATFNGCHDYDDRLSDASEAGIREEHRFSKQWYQELAKEKSAYDKNQTIDFKIFEDSIALSEFYIDEIKSWQKKPGMAEEAADIIFFMMTREVADQEKHFKNILERLKQIPQFIKQGESRIKNPQKRFRDLYLQISHGTPIIFDALIDACQKKCSPALAGEISKEVSKIKPLLKTHQEWLKNLTVDETESWLLGKNKFEKLLKLRRLGIDSKDLLALGEDYLKKTREELTKLASKIVLNGNVDDARKKIGLDHIKDFKKALEVVKKTSLEAKNYLKANDLLDFPSNIMLEVMETPEFLKHTIPFAAIFTPSKFDPHQKGVYIVTNSNDPKFMEDTFNSASIYNTAVHEAYPGHHLQLSYANLNCSMIRSAHIATGSHATENIEGWAHYCEEMMKDAGFHDTPEGRFVMLDDQMWRAVRIIIDVKLATGQMTFDEAVKMLMDVVSKNKESATSEVNRYIMAPGYVLSYLYGKHLIKEIKGEYKKKTGSSFSEKKFHNAFLSCGTIPLHYARKIILGENV